MPQRRRRPVIEEIVETPSKKKEEVKAPVHHEVHHRKEEVVEENPVYTQTVKQVASYDEPPQDTSTPPVSLPSSSPEPEAAAREFLNDGVKPSKKTNMKLILVIVVITALVVGFIAGGVYVYVSGVSDNGIVPVETPTPEPTVSPTNTPTPKPVVKLDTLSVNVLNGSGVIGAAGKIKDALEASGFSVSGTGNAANYSFKETVIQTKADTSEDVITALKNALSGYTVTVGDNLPSTSKYDIVVTAGKE